MRMFRKLTCLFSFVLLSLTTTSQSNFKTGTVTLNGIKFTYLEKGNGPLVIAFHGFPDIPATFHYQADALAAAGYRVIAPYTRGYYPTDTAADGCYHSACLINDATAFIDHFVSEKDKVILLGHDWGAVAAYGAAILHPEKVSHLITMAVPKRGFSSSLISNGAQQRRSWYIFFFQMGFAPAAVAYNNFALIDQLWKEWSPGWKIPKEHLDRIKSTLGKPGVLAAVLNYYRQNFGEYNLNSSMLPIAKRYNEVIKVNTLYLHGADDGCVGVEVTSGLEKAFSGNFEKHIIKNAGHFLHLEKPKEINKLIIDFLKK